MKFSELAQYFDRIQKNSSRLIITEILAELFNKLSSSEIEKVVYLLQGKVAPSYQGLEFGMAERTIIKAVISALNIEKSYFEKEFKKIGDLGKTVEKFKYQYASFEETDLEIKKVFDSFYKIATLSGTGSQETKMNILSTLIRQLDSISARFLVRIPTGDIRMGFSDMTILDSYSWMIKGDKSLRPMFQKAYHVRPELGFIGRLIKEKGFKELDKIEPVIFTPIIMMRAERMSSAKEILEQLGECLVEPKFDGFRLQIHLRSDPKGSDLVKVKLFSRNLDDVTYMYPDIVKGVMKEIRVDNAIFEGEAIGYNPKTKEFLPFQETATRKRKYGIEEKAKNIPLKLFIFELLYLNGENLINNQFSERRKLLESIINPNNSTEKNTVLLAAQEKVNKETRLEKLFDQAVEKKLEGIIAKKINGVYKPGAREWNWIKYKKSYSSKINDTVDCLVMGYDFGKGKRTNFGIGAFLVGIYDEKKEVFVSIAKIGTGLTDDEWRSLEVKSQKFRLRQGSGGQAKIKPNNYLVNKAMECDVWVEPKIVVEIRADEISKSPVHTAGLALRFPRLERFRDDKKPDQSTTLKEVEKMFQNQ